MAKYSRRVGRSSLAGQSSPARPFPPGANAELGRWINVRRRSILARKTRRERPWNCVGRWQMGQEVRPHRNPGLGNPGDRPWETASARVDAERPPDRAHGFILGDRGCRGVLQHQSIPGLGNAIKGPDQPRFLRRFVQTEKSYPGAPSLQAAVPAWRIRAVPIPPPLDPPLGSLAVPIFWCPRPPSGPSPPGTRSDKEPAARNGVGCEVRGWSTFWGGWAQSLPWHLVATLAIPLPATKRRRLVRPGDPIRHPQSAYLPCWMAWCSLTGRQEPVQVR